MAHFDLDTSQIQNRWDNSVAPRITVAPGDTVTLDMHDASDNQAQPGMSGVDFGKIDFTKIHALTGPIAIDGAVPGDQVVIDILEYQHRGYAWTSIIPGMGLLNDFVDEHFLFHWELEKTVSTLVCTKKNVNRTPSTADM